MPKHPNPGSTEEGKPDITKTVEYRRFHRLLKTVIKAPPMNPETKPVSPRHGNPKAAGRKKPIP